MLRAFSFGASTAQGTRDTEGGGFIARIGKRLDEDGKGVAENFGIGGHTTDDMLPRLLEIPVHGANDIAIVTLGSTMYLDHPIRNRRSEFPSNATTRTSTRSLKPCMVGVASSTSRSIRSTTSSVD